VATANAEQAAEQQRQRLVGVDVARGIALLGMMAVHVFPVGDEDGGTSLVHHVASGRAAALFAVLAGVGLALLSGGPRPRPGAGLRRSVAVRALLVALIGLVLGDVESGLAVILVYYGVLFVVALPLLGLRARTLALLAVAVALAGPLLSHAVRPYLPERAPGNPSLGLLVVDPGGLLATLLVTGYYPVLCWTAYLCAGLAVGRLRLGSRRVQARLVVGGAVLAVVAALASSVLLGPLRGEERIAAADGPDADLVSNQYGDVPTTTLWWLATDAPHSSTPPDLLHTTGTALVVIGLALLVTRWVAAGRLLRPLAAAGSMTLTLYSVHVVVVAATDTDRHLLLWGVQVVVFAVFAVLWLRAVPRGPLETVVAGTAGR
jgi:uncharacterized membrane protein